jgi:tetratricopeptide (TPR) repeat protein
LVLVLLAGACATAPPAPPPEPDRPFGFRDPLVGLPPGALASSFRRNLRLGMEALSAGDLARAEKAFRTGLATSPDPAPFRLGLAFVAIAKGTLPDARKALDEILTARPEYPPAVEARADVDSAEGRRREAMERYRALQKLLPEDARARAREREMKTALGDQRRKEADAALRDKDLNAARRAAVSLVELDGTSPFGLQYLSRAAEAGGNLEDAYLTAQKARALDRNDRAWTANVAELAMKTGRYAEAQTLFSELAVKDPALKARAEAAHMEFRIQNLPEVARRAAISSKLSRAQFAALAYWLVPEVREAAPPAAPQLATDAVERPERQALVRTIGLGFFTVARETHTVGADVALTRADLATLLKKVAAVVAGKRSRPGCLAAKHVTPASLAECGILAEGNPKSVTGKEAAAALEAAAGAARGGGTSR